MRFKKHNRRHARRASAAEQAVRDQALALAVRQPELNRQAVLEAARVTIKDRGRA